MCADYFRGKSELDPVGRMEKRWQCTGGGNVKKAQWEVSK